MNRKEFLKIAGVLGIGLPLVGGCGALRSGTELSEQDQVLIIGAGAAGLSAAYLLKQRGISAQILEAASVYGGRMKRTTEFADFPIALGAEWLHVKKEILDEIVNDPSVQLNVPTSPYNFEEDDALLDGEKASLEDLGFSIDQKFIGGTWFDFFERYIVPSIKNQIEFNQIVEAIDYTGDKINVKTARGEFQADKVILTVPLKLLQQGAIRFNPPLPEKKAAAIREVTVWDGCKTFIEFSEKFYPTAIGFKSEPETAGHKLIYDAAYGQQSQQNILGVFAAGAPSLPYLQASDSERIRLILSELDELFEGKASQFYVKHIFQNWSAEPFAQGAYVWYYVNWRDIRELGQPVDQKLYFAGDAYTNGRDWSSVHAAAEAAKRVVSELLHQ